MSIRGKIFRWFRQGNTPTSLTSPQHNEDDEQPLQGEVKLTIRPAQNGRLITMQAYKPVPGPHSDWQVTLYLVPHGDDLIQAITVLLVGAKTGK